LQDLSKASKDASSRGKLNIFNTDSKNKNMLGIDAELPADYGDDDNDDFNYEQGINLSAFEKNESGFLGETIIHKLGDITRGLDDVLR